MSERIATERAVLGAILIDAAPRLLPEVSLLVPEDFATQTHRRIFRAMLSLHARDEPIDEITVNTEMGEREGQQSFLAQLAGDTPTAANIIYHTRSLRKLSRLEAYRRAIREHDHRLTTADEDPDLVAAELTQALRAIGDDRATVARVKLKEIIREEISRLEKDPKAHAGHTTGFKALDKYIGGFCPGDLIFLGARPSMGKTAMATQMADAVGQTGGDAVFYSLEMNRQQLAMRYLSQGSGVDMARIRRGEVFDSEWSLLANAANRYWRSQVELADPVKLSILELEASARTWAASQDNPVLIVVDYLQLVRGVGGTREQEVASVSKTLKAIARETGCAVLALSQLNRALEQRQNKRPMLSDLRESGSQEQDADVVLFLYRDEFYDPDTKCPGVAELAIAKQRSGPIGCVRLGFEGKAGRFAEQWD